MSIEIIRLKAGELNTMRLSRPNGVVLEVPLDSAVATIAMLHANKEISPHQHKHLLGLVESLRNIADETFDLDVEFEIPVPKAGN